jgi:ubiquinone/menaquinone biosynthesis C-methylase UbiE
MTQTAQRIHSHTSEELKNRQRRTWGDGDYAQVGATLQIVGENLAESIPLRAGQRVLDVAAGNGNFTLAAARRCTQVTSTDLVPMLLEKGRIRAMADGFDIEFLEADAEALPFEAASFDAAASVFGVMFTPDQQRSAAELCRVVRPGGRIGLANWTPNGFIGRLFKTIGSYVPNPLPSPALWGTTEHIDTLFAAHATDIRITTRQFNFRYPSVATWLDNFKQVYGPLKNAFAALDGGQQAAMHADILALLEDLNDSEHGDMMVPGEYLEIVIDRA